MKELSFSSSPFAAGVLAFYALWVLVTICNQFNHRNAFLARINALLVVPRWTFFAPKPGVHDYHLLYRVQREDGQLGAFSEVLIRNPNRDLSAAIWNHRKRVPKMIFDVSMALMEALSSLQKNKHDVAVLKITFHYLMLLHIVGTYCRQELGNNVQFVLIRTEGHLGQNPPAMVFTSDFHLLAA